MFFYNYVIVTISEEIMAPHSSTHAWKIPWMEEPGGLQSMGSLGVGHDWATSLSLSTFMHWRRKWQPTPVFLPRESHGRGSLVGFRLWGRTESDMSEATYQQQQQQATVHGVAKSWTRLSNFTFTFSSLQSLSPILCDPMNPRPPCPTPTPRVHPNPCPLSQWCHPTTSSSVIPFSSCPQSFPTSGSFQMSQLFTSGDQSIGVSASASVLPMNIQNWFPLGWTGWISLQSKGPSRVFSNTTVPKEKKKKKVIFSFS